jgi:hypothetical protein
MRVIVVISLFLASCSALKQAQPVENQKLITQDNISILDGEYGLFTQYGDKASLDLCLLFKKYWWRDFDNKKKYKLSLKAIDKQKIEVSVFKGDSLIETKNIRYKIEDGALIIKQKKIRPFYFVLNGFGTMRTRLRLLNTGELVVNHHNFQVVTLTLIPMAGDRVDDYGIVFKRRVP